MHLPKVTCRAARINQVVMNLLSNAIDACVPGGKVTVRTGAENGHVFIDVIDDGTGIDPLIRERIFDPILHHQADRQGNRPGSLDQLRDRSRPRRHD